MKALFFTALVSLNLLATEGIFEGGIVDRLTLTDRDFANELELSTFVPLFASGRLNGDNYSYPVVLRAEYRNDVERTLGVVTQGDREEQFAGEINLFDSDSGNHTFGVELDSRLVEVDVSGLCNRARGLINEETQGTVIQNCAYIPIDVHTRTSVENSQSDTDQPEAARYAVVQGGMGFESIVAFSNDAVLRGAIIPVVGVGVNRGNVIGYVALGFELEAGVAINDNTTLRMYLNSQIGTGEAVLESIAAGFELGFEQDNGNLLSLGMGGRNERLDISDAPRSYNRAGFVGFTVNYDFVDFRPGRRQ